MPKIDHNQLATETQIALLDDIVHRVSSLLATDPYEGPNCAVLSAPDDCLPKLQFYAVSAIIRLGELAKERRSLNDRIDKLNGRIDLMRKSSVESDHRGK